ncbi:MAG: citramalate synthase [Chloroflexi bacterium]|nr:citramalate synthase [Chloroflexota bacterium]
MTHIDIYDTTLRDGSQGEGVSFSLEDKLKVALRLDAMGIPYIEGGWPGSNAKDAHFFQRARNLPFKQARLAAFGATRRANTTCEADPQIAMLLDAETPVVTIVGKTWDLHVHRVIETTLEENLAMIVESVRYLKAHGRQVFYDAEHFFDGYKANPDYALATVRAAYGAGADAVILCDTNGGSLPWEVGEIVRATAVGADLLGEDSVLELRGETRPYVLGIHTHDDGGVAVANALAAVQAGATQVQGTINGYGERVGNCDLCTVIPNLQLKMGFTCLTPADLGRLTELSRFVSETANMAPDNRQPFVGASAFAHKGGIHVAAIMKAEASYQHIDPTLVGNAKRVLVSELSGRGNLVYKAQELGVDASKEDAQRVLAQIKELESRGFYFEGAEASVALMLRRLQPGYRPPFELVDFMAVVEHRQGRGIFAEATVKVRIGDEIAHTVAEGNGPVNALDRALRKALLPHYPQLADIQLADYKVRILDGDAATGSTTRVIIDTRNGHSAWSTVGASTNIIESSWQALADSMEYALLSA